jgi:hypothetical protein
MTTAYLVTATWASLSMAAVYCLRFAQPKAAR